MNLNGFMRRTLSGEAKAKKRAYDLQYVAKHREKRNAYSLQWANENRQRKRAYDRKRYIENHEEALVRSRKYHSEHRKEAQVRAIGRRDKVKREVLTKYSPKGMLGCSWIPCSITDIDMLTLDHIANNGHSHRDDKGRRITGTYLYGWVQKREYPEGYQTLCMNHQLKKAIEVKRKGRLSYK